MANPLCAMLRCLTKKKIRRLILTMLDIDIEEISNANYCAALDIIKELKIEEIWEKHNSKANLVGSVKTKLLMNHLDIDYHIYSDDFSIEKSFSAIGEIANHPKISKILYINSTWVKYLPVNCTFFLQNR
jgi:hypothetical protein